MKLTFHLQVFVFITTAFVFSSCTKTVAINSKIPNTQIKKNEVVTLLKGLNEYYESYFYNPQSSLKVDCEFDDLEILFSSTMDGDTTYVLGDYFCDDTLVYPTSPYITTIIYLQDKPIGFNVGRSYVKKVDYLIDSILAQ